MRGHRLYGSWLRGGREVLARFGTGVSGGTVGSCLLMVVSSPGAMFSTPGARVWKILLSSRSDVRWSSWNWASCPRKRGCCKAWVSSQAAWIAASLWVSSGSGTAFGKKEMVSTMSLAWVRGTQTR